MKKSIHILFLSLLVTSLQAQDYKYQSLFVYNFTKYIQWPANAQSGDFVIGVLGNSPMVGELEKVSANKMVGTQKIVVKKLSNVAEAETCQMVFIPLDSSPKFDAALEALKNKPILVITEKDGLGKRGSGINFVINDGKMRFELNQAATQSAGLKVSSQLTSLAIAM
jgi:hypothetical protein